MQLAIPGFVSPEGPRPEEHLKAPTYLKAIPLKRFEDTETIKMELETGNIVITNISPLAKTNIDEVRRAVSALSEFTAQIGGDIARLGEERVVLTPRHVKIWKGDSEEADKSRSTVYLGDPSRREDLRGEGV